MSKIFLRKKISDRISEGHPWIYKNEVGHVEGNLSSEMMAEVYSSAGSFVGKGYMQPNSQIMIRLLTKNKDENIDFTFFERKINKAWQLRRAIGKTNNCRLIFGEADGLPGLVVDKYGDLLVIQTLTKGIEMFKNEITKALIQIINPQAIYEKNDSAIRKKELLPNVRGFLHGKGYNLPLKIKDNGFHFWVDIEKGQQTGYYLDRSHLRKAIAPYVKGATVLDVFCNTGSWSVHALGYGAEKTIGIEQSEDAIKLAIKNVELNFSEQKHQFINANAFDLLRLFAKEKKQFDTIILNPPSFSTKKEDIEKAISGYKEIHLRSVQLMKQKGFLITCISAFHINDTDIVSMFKSITKDTGRQIKQINYIGQSSDFPIMWHIPHTSYLRMFVLEIE